MFKIIEPKYHCFASTPINNFMGLVKSRIPFGLSRQEQNKATFILCDRLQTDVCGGAVLLRKDVDDFPLELSNTLLDFMPQQENVWKCMVFLSFAKNSTLYETNESDHFCQSFYRNLYNNLVAFGAREDAGFLCVSLDSQEYFCTDGLTSWPYVFELKPQQSSDGNFHGILSLTGSQYEDYQKNCKAGMWSYTEKHQDEYI